MRELNFKVEFKSPVILQASSNTQGKIDLLDFIPSSNFLGMVAKNYSEFKNAFDIFHSGKVRFGDASPFANGKEYFKIPLSYFHEKLDKDRIFNHHFIENFSEFNQLKQIRSGYMSSDFERLDLEYNYSQKSGYDKENRRSKDGAMYGYAALKSGTFWKFSVKIDDSISKNDEDKIVQILLKSSTLGKSKSSEYGEIQISKISNDIQKIEEFNSDDFIYLYTKSRLALVDENGSPTLDLKHILKDLNKDNICYEKTQIRTSSFTPFNFARGAKDYERLVINKGSVIVLKGLSSDQKSKLKQGIGAFLSEGFGEVFINPKFLKSGDSKGKKDTNLIQNPIKFVKKDTTASLSLDKQNISSDLAKFLYKKRESKEEELIIAQNVFDFIYKNRGVSRISNSQWGAIRSLCLVNTDETITTAIEKFITKGVTKDQWEDFGEVLLKEIKNTKQDQKLKFVRLLAMKAGRAKDE